MLKQLSVICLAAFVAGCTALATDKKVESKTNPIVEIKTSMGTIKAELFADKAPITVKNFLDYVKAKHYNGTIFHRVISNFMIQGGNFKEDFSKKSTGKAIKNEAHNKLENKRGTLAMARTFMVHSATDQFFINLKDNAFLNHRDKSSSGYGYCVFGKVISGMDVVDKIGKVTTGSRGRYRDVPVTPVIIKEITIVKKSK